MSAAKVTAKAVRADHRQITEFLQACPLRLPVMALAERRAICAAQHIEVGRHSEARLLLDLALNDLGLDRVEDFTPSAS